MIQRKPEWLKIKRTTSGTYTQVRQIVEQHGLNTICSSGNCPNINSCWSSGTATFMILGDICTRACRFCATKTGKPLDPDPAEPENVAESVRLMKLKHCVITSVDRDDLPDKGADFWAETIRAIRRLNPGTVIEALVPDFDAGDPYLKKVFDAAPDIFGHNLETVRRLSPAVRSRADYSRSLQVLEKAASHGLVTKSGIMVGLGETEAEVLETFADLRKAGCRMMTVGQYLQPTRNNIPVSEYVTPQQFEKYRIAGIEAGFAGIESAPLVRSSFMAEKSFAAAHIIPGKNE